MVQFCLKLLYEYNETMCVSVSLTTDGQDEKWIGQFFQVCSMCFGKFAKNWLWFILSARIYLWYLVLGDLRASRAWSKMLSFNSSTVWDKIIKTAMTTLRQKDPAFIHIRLIIVTVIIIMFISIINSHWMKWL